MGEASQKGTDMTERALMALFDAGHRLSLPNGYWVRKDDDNIWQVGQGVAYLAFNIQTNVPCGRDGSFDGQALEFVKAMRPRLTEQERAVVEHWRPNINNKICRCVADQTCEYHALTAIIDRLTDANPSPV